ncbi:alpha/beta hydrolase [Alloscardovia venturai]|uniref:Alpha/beta hydrolase n=1 Tax=Alloscardovia venturai TaxID=1769421 RepID=A0ABW2Y7I5_9BIFI
MVSHMYTHGPGPSDNSSPSAIVTQARAAQSWMEAGRLWSYIDEDCVDDTQDTRGRKISSKAKQAAIAMRKASAQFDYERIKNWQLPDDVVGHLAIPYTKDDDRGHYLDVFAPKDASEGHKYPVIIDDHGGGFVYGMRELNRSFAMHLAHRGYVVVLPSYRPGPCYNFVEILTDLSLAYLWTAENIAHFGGDMDRLFLTGDSAGACMALHSAQIENSYAMSMQTCVPQAGLKIRGLLLVCGIYDLSARMDTSEREARHELDALDALSPEVFGTVRDNFTGFTGTNELLGAAAMPPVFINTATDDFLHDENIDLYKRLVCKGVDVELDDADTNEWGELGHVYVVGLATHPRSQITLDKMDCFIHRVLADSATESAV